MKKINSKNVLINTINLKLCKNRNFIILPNLVKKELHIYNGKNFEKIIVEKNMVGHKIGEFSKTRKDFSFKKKLKK